jgi:NADH dehydrogenase
VTPLPCPCAARPPNPSGRRRHVAGTVTARLAGTVAPPPFRYKDKGTMATIGPRKAVVDAYGLRIGGLLGSLMWAFIHVMYLIGWGNRVITTLRWLIQMTTQNRSQRLVDVRHAASWSTGTIEDRAGES